MHPTLLPDPSTPAEQVSPLTPQLSIGSCYAKYDDFDVVVNLAYRYNDHEFEYGKVRRKLVGDKTVYFVGIHDKVTERIDAVLPHLIPALELSIEQGKRVLVHCAAGRSRSGAVVVALLSVMNGWSYDEALAYVQQRRPIVLPNEGFELQLRQYLRAYQ